jgi:hypothetical protein
VWLVMETTDEMEIFFYGNLKRWIYDMNTGIAWALGAQKGTLCEAKNKRT